MKTGLLLGKFYPPHRGHLELIESMFLNVQMALIVVGSKPEQEIPGSVRVKWLKQLVPKNTWVIEVPDNNPEGLTEKDEEYWTIWRDNLFEHMPWKPNYIYGSDPYVITLSNYLHMLPMVIDTERKNVPISATMIRNDPKKYWDFIPEPVQKYYENILNH